ncbi:hypothetical protein AB0467_18650 [Streptomyces sp. NPDC052095]|uniref:hypothetical protein n=1 Tax=unclassified Streptomyces TaxID=2593676 RepID=UPI00344CE4E7
MHPHSVDRPADLDVVRDSYDRVADNYADMVVTTGIGELRLPPEEYSGPGLVVMARRPD